jgi:hypothetical protein
MSFGTPDFDAPNRAKQRVSSQKNYDLSCNLYSMLVKYCDFSCNENVHKNIAKVLEGQLTLEDFAKHYSKNQWNEFNEKLYNKIIRIFNEVTNPTFWTHIRQFRANCWLSFLTSD